MLETKFNRVIHYYYYYYYYLKNDLTIIYLQNHYSTLSKKGKKKKKRHYYRRQWFSNSRRSNSSYLFFLLLLFFLSYNGEGISTLDVLEILESINPSYLNKFVIINIENIGACNNWYAMIIKYQVCWHI